MTSRISLCFFLLASIIIWGCESHLPNPSGIEKKSIERDTVFHKKEKFVYFKTVTDSSYLVAWSQGQGSTSSCDTIPEYPSGRLNLWFSDKEAFGLRQGCGSNCSIAYVFSWGNKMNCEEVIPQPIAVDTLQNRIAFAPWEGDTLAVIMDYVLMQSQALIKPSCNPKAASVCLKELIFKKDSVEITWLGPTGDQRVAKELIVLQ